jgi:hypothetical protein
MKKDITNNLTQAVNFWAAVEAEFRQSVGPFLQEKPVWHMVLISVYAVSYNVSIPSSLAFSQECLTGPLDGQTIDTKICAILICDDGPVAGKVAIEGNSGFDDTVNTGNNDKKH